MSKRGGEMVSFVSDRNVSKESGESIVPQRMGGLRTALLLVCLVAMHAVPAFARWPYLAGLGPHIDDRMNAIDFDSTSNAYVGGAFSGAVTLAAMNRVSAGQQDLVVAKLNSDGEIQWAATAGGPGIDDVWDLAVDAAGNIYIVGPLCLSPGAVGETCTSTFGGLGSVAVPTNGQSAYVAKLNTAGVWQWIRTITRSGPSDDAAFRIKAVALDGDNVFVSGWFEGALTSAAGGGFSIDSRTGRQDVWVGKLTSSGQWSGVQSWPQASPDLAATDFLSASLVVQDGEVVSVAQAVPPLPAAPTSLIISGGPQDVLPGGGSCTVSGVVTNTGGASVTCSGVNLGAHTRVYFGIRNDTFANGNTMTGAAPSGASVFSFSGSTPSSISYVSTTSVNNVLGSSTEAVDNSLTLTAAAGDLTLVNTGGTPASNANGAIERLFEVESSSFTVQVEVQSRSTTIPSFGPSNPQVYNPIHTPASGSADFSRVDVTFYVSDCGDGVLDLPEVCDQGPANGTPTSCCTSTCTLRTTAELCEPSTDVRLVVLSADDLAVEAPDGVDLGFNVQRIAGDGANGLAAIGFLPGGEDTTFGADTVSGPALVIGRANLTNPVGPLSRIWAASVESGGTFSVRNVEFGVDGTVYTTANYDGTAEFFPETVPDLDPIAPSAPGQEEDIFVAAVDGQTGEWIWSTRGGGEDFDFPTDIAVDRANPDGGLAITGSYTAPAALGEFDFGLCESTCPVLENSMQVEKPCNPLNASTLCTLSSCNIPLFCLGGQTPPARTSFAMRLESAGEWFLPAARWIVGQEVPRPTGVPALRPTFETAGNFEPSEHFLWAGFERKLYAIKPTDVPIVVKWQRFADPTLGTEDATGTIRLPLDPQIHLSTAPVDVVLSQVNRCPAASDRPFSLCERDQDCGVGHQCAPLGAASRWTFGGIRYQTSDSDATVDGGTNVFNATSGHAVLLFVNGPTPNPDNHPVAIAVVRTLNPATAASGAPSPCTIGTAVTDSGHRDPNRKNGWVVFADSHYDGSGPDAAYTRNLTRRGPILPVNRDTADPKDDMLVAWYRQDARGIAWPVVSTKYTCEWPTDPDAIVVASELGSDGRCRDVRGACQVDEECASGPCIVQPPLDPAAFPNARIYDQPDPEQPGFNPNEEHALLVPSNAGTGFNAVFALRTDLNVSEGLSEPYVLLKYRDPVSSDWAMRVYEVVLSDAPYTENYEGTAGGKVDPPYPLNLLPACAESCAPLADDCATPGPRCAANVCVGGSLAGEACANDAACLSTCLQQGIMDELCGGAGNTALFKDYNAIGPTGTWQGWWARAAGSVKARFHYPLQPGFFTDLNLDGVPDRAVGACEPWLVSGAEQRDVSYSIAWPAEVPTLQVGETLLEPKRGLPAISSQAAVEVVFETTSTSSEPQNESAELVRLIDPLSPRFVNLATLPTDIVTERRGLTSQIIAGMNGLVRLSPGLSARVSHDANSGRLSFAGVFDETGLGDPLLLLNVMTAREQDELLALSTNAAWRTAVRALYNRSRNPNGVDTDGGGEPDEALLVGFTMDGNRVVREKLLGDKALTAGLAKDTGYVTLAFNNDPGLGALPVSLAVVRVDCGPYQGQVQLIPASNIFDEQITLHHSGDFAGDPSSLDFEWYYALKESDCQSMSVPPYPDPVLAPWIPLESGAGVSDVTLSGPGITSLADVCVLSRYRGYSVCNNQTVPSQWAGAPLGPTQLANPKSQLVPGWLVRVTEGLNPFDQRTSDFRNNEVNTLANALVAAGARFEGPIAFNPDADALDGVGLIEIYETVLGRGSDLSINEGISIDAVNSKLLDVAARVSDLYMLFGNEAFGDALDPTIGFDTSGQFGTAAPSIFAFQDQLDSLLSEELTLLRGRDSAGGARPVYNRLVWNFTGRDGQVAYQQNYNITDQDSDGDIDEFDARTLYPQGHGDAWGHYLTAIKGYYSLLRHPNFRWVPRADSVLVAGSEVQVDFTDERRFATAAAARARAGAQIVDLTYRARWVDDPAGQWQGYKDTNTARAFGVSEWAQRAGQGAYFDWVVANGILPPQSDAPPGIEKIDRTTVPELGEIVAQSDDVQAQVDLVDQGMNPLGLAKNVVPFDIDPLFLQIGTSVQGLTHFEQISDRANETLGNAVRVFNYANGLTQLLRRNQDTAVDFSRNIAAQERDYNNRLIETFGSPYPEDIGPTGTYRAGYEGPDIWNWDVSDPSEVAGEIPGLLTDSTTEYSLSVRAPEYDNCAGNEGTCRFDPSGKLRYNSDGTLVTTASTINVRLSNRGYGRVKDPSWTTRQSPGELQLARSELLQTRAQFERSVANYSRLIGDIECTIATIRGQNRLAADRLVILNRTKNTRQSFNELILGAKGVELGLRRTSTVIRDFLGAATEGLPKVVGLAVDATSGIRAALLAVGVAGVIGLDIAADVAQGSQLAFEQAADIEAQIDGIAVRGLEDDFEIFNLLGTLGERLRQEPVLRIEALTLAESVQQSAARLQQTLARGGRLIDELEAFRKRTASKVADSRYSDLAFRIFRNDALQKYRAQLDLASRYVYLAAASYDYETNLQGTSEQAGRRFLTDIVRQRSLGQFVDGEPIAGSAGLGDTLARMNANFSVLKGQLGFNNPQTETNRFSLRRELFRLLPESDDEWRARLAQHRVDNLWDIEEFRRFARAPRAESDGPLPGILIPIPTNVTFGLNFFGWPLAGGDSAYDPTNFATKVRTVGVWFGNYNVQGLSNTPRVYLIPTGADVLRTPAANDFRARNWAILDQRIPVPFAIGQSALDDRTWSPRLDSLSDPIGDIRRFSSFRAFHDSGTFSSGQVTTESRAIGRSVWNTRWMLMITGGTLLSDADDGLDTFIYGQPLAGPGPIVDPDGVARDGQGVDDILVFFQTYALSGN